MRDVQSGADGGVFQNTGKSVGETCLTAWKRYDNLSEVMRRTAAENEYLELSKAMPVFLFQHKQSGVVFFFPCSKTEDFIKMLRTKFGSKLPNLP